MSTINMTTNVEQPVSVLPYSKDRWVAEIRKSILAFLNQAMPRFFSQLHDDLGRCAEQATNLDAEDLYCQAQLDIRELQSSFGQEITARILAKYDLYWGMGSNQNIKAGSALPEGAFELETTTENNIRCLITNLVQSRTHDAAGIIQSNLVEVNQMFCNLATRTRLVDANPISPSRLFAALERSLEIKGFKEDIVEVIVTAYDTQIVAPFSLVYGEILMLASQSQLVPEEAREDGGPVNVQVRKESARNKPTNTVLGKRAGEGAGDKQLSTRNIKLIDIVGRVLQQENIPDGTRLKLIKLLLPAIKGAMVCDDRVKFATIIKTINKIAKEEIAEASKTDNARQRPQASKESGSAKEGVQPRLADFLGVGIEEDLVLEGSAIPNWWVRPEGGTSALNSR